jgi:hypothetical protein
MSGSREFDAYSTVENPTSFRPYLASRLADAAALGGISGNPAKALALTRIPDI